MFPYGGDLMNQFIDGYTFVAKALRRLQIELIYGVVGIPVTQLAPAAQREGIKYFGMRNEQSAGYAAAAAGYLSGRPAVCLTVSGPGFIHGLAGLAHATANCFPMLLISGSCDPEILADKKGGFQELDQIKTAGELAKTSFKANSISEIPSVLSEAVSATMKGRPGGVYLDLPVTVLHEKVDMAQAEKLLGNMPCILPETEVAVQADIERAMALLKSAESPLIVIGKGAAYSGAENAILEFINNTGIPFLATPMGKGVISDEHELSAAAARSYALKNADVVFVIGARLNWILHFGEFPRWADNCKFIILDVYEKRPEKADIYLHGDAKSTMDNINNMELTCNLSSPENWAENIRSKSTVNINKFEQKLTKLPQIMDHYSALRVIRDELEKLPDVFVTSEGANTMDIARSVIPIRKSKRRLDAGTWGTMGVGLGNAIAAATVFAEIPVVAIEGDSGFGFSGMDVEVLCRYNLNVKIIVFNNGGIYRGDEIRVDSDIPAPTQFTEGIRYDRIIEAFGGEGYCAENEEQLKLALNDALSTNKPVLINCIIDPTSGTESGSMQSHN